MNGVDERKESPPQVSSAVLSAELSPAQLLEFESALCALHRSSNPSMADHDGDESMDGSLAESGVPLFFFTTSEWNAFCRQVAAALSRSTYSFHLAECERFSPTSQSMKVELKHEWQPSQCPSDHDMFTANALKTVFVSKIDAIHLADRMRM